MSTLEAKVPDLLLQQLQELAHKQKVSVDQVVSSALAAQVSAHSTRESAASRARRVHWPAHPMRAGCCTVERKTW